MPDQKFRLRHVIKNFPEMKNEWSKEEVHFGVPWRLCLVHNNDYLSVYLHCERKDQKNSWSIDVGFEARLSTNTGELKPWEKGEAKFENKHSQGGWGFRKFHLWQEVVKNNMIGNTVVVECDVVIKNMTGIAKKRMIDFNKPKENLTDVVLKVEEQKFHVAKMVLAVHSTYFETLFFKDFKESKSSEIVLNDVDAADFQAFLEIVYGYSSMTEENVEGILELADRFDAALICEKCEEFLQKSAQIDKRKKLQLADTFRLENLKRDCIGSIKSTDDLRQFLPSNVTDLGHSTLAALLQQISDPKLKT